MHVLAVGRPILLRLVNGPKGATITSTRLVIGSIISMIIRLKLKLTVYNGDLLSSALSMIL